MLHENNSEPIELERADNGEIKSKIKSKIDNKDKNELRTESKNWQMPANLVAAEFGEVNVWRHIPETTSGSAECRVEFSIAMEPQGKFAEGWRTGLALDASASMKRAYGRKVEARVDPELLVDYIKQGRLRSYLEDGEPIRKIKREAFAEIQERGYEINYTENILQPLVQDFTAYLAGSLDGTGKTSLIYWGCGEGNEIQVLGEFDHASCQQLAIAGPATFKLGKTTKLLPAIAYFVNQYRQAQQGLYVFLTDGRIDDLEQVKNYTKELALEIAVGKRNYLKLILIGIGNDVDRYQLQELDDFDTGLDIDIWDYKIASEMTSLSQIFAEVVNENQVIADRGSIYDDQGNCVKSYPKGLPAKVDFVMRDDSQWFELEVGNQRIRQAVVVGTAMAIAPFVKKQLFDFEVKAQENEQAAVLDDQEQEITNNQIAAPSSLWKILAGLLIGAAFIGIAIAFGILIQRSDDSKLQNQAVPKVIKESVLEPKPDFTNKDNNNVLTSVPQSSSTTPSPESDNKKTKPTTSKAPTNKLNRKSDNLSSNNSAQVPDKLSSNNSGNNENNSLTNSGKVAGDNPKKLIGDNASNNNETTSIDNSPKNTDSDNFNNSKNTPKRDLKNDPNSPSQNKNSDRRINSSIFSSILPITNPDVEVVVFFASDESQLVSSEEAKIDDFWSKIQRKRGIIQVSGHADKMGDYDYNLDLSQARANEVVNLLRDRGLDGNYKVTFEALSWLQPLRKDITATDQAFNRRVVIQFKELR
ncbi:OmpA family protein [Pseudanabaena galeata UHCC 0370]|uniref:OmpA family protein n=1 Tax=Pseudanabaena galeata UHCC 0370 TaxID=3110310 RepID=A0ABU5TMH5_9CYAN|nr:OmpA family protein [Pseudanabaena galeata]MEA5479454.1 OmpA family protein [Pseudanabaena galeata UHCC 0370]